MHVVCGPDDSEGDLGYGLGMGCVQGSAGVGATWLAQGIAPPRGETRDDCSAEGW